MAAVMPITRPAAAEVRNVCSPTPTASSFSALLVALNGLIDAERDLVGVDYWDPALSHWLRDAERAQDEVVDALRAVRQARVQRAEDHPMRRLAMVVDAIIGSEDPASFVRLHRLVSEHATLFRCAGSGVAARRVDHMLIAGLALVDELATLDLYDGPPPDGEPADLSTDVGAAWMLALT